MPSGRCRAHLVRSLLHAGHRCPRHSVLGMNDDRSGFAHTVTSGRVSNVAAQNDGGRTPNAENRMAKVRDPSTNRSRKAGIAAIAHLTMNTTIEKKGILMSTTVTSLRCCSISTTSLMLMRVTGSAARRRTFPPATAVPPQGASSAEMPPDPLAPEADSHLDLGTSPRNPRGTRGSRVDRSSLRATSASRTPSGNFPPR